MGNSESLTIVIVPVSDASPFFWIDALRVTLDSGMTREEAADFVAVLGMRKVR